MQEKLKKTVIRNVLW